MKYHIRWNVPYEEKPRVNITVSSKKELMNLIDKCVDSLYEENNIVELRLGQISVTDIKSGKMYIVPFSPQ